MDTVPNNLPLQLTSFIGREQEIAEVKRLLTTTRLLTLTGAGGCGKTRLAGRVGFDLLDRFADGVWFVDLAPLSNPALVPQAVAAPFGLREAPGSTLMETLAGYLRERQVLLLLDNCEHLLVACAQLAESLLQACPRLAILATSRGALGIGGEMIYTVPSLTSPGPEQRLPLEVLAQYEAVRLFVARAIAVQPGFSLTDQNGIAVAQVCRRLDGIPLAIELAAARIRALPVEQIAARLDDRFRLLTGGSRTALPRQQTLRGAIDWSYNLLSESERLLLGRLSVFAGGWTLEAAEAVCAGEPLEARDVLDQLAHLVDKSLVIAGDQRGEARFRMLETVRQYAREKLLETDDENRILDRHLEHFMRLAETAEPEFRGAEQLPWLNRIEADLDNVRIALNAPAGASGIEKQLRLAAALRIFWYVRGHQTECIETLQALLVRLEATDRTTARAKALSVLSEYYMRIRNYPQAKLAAEEALTIGRERGDALMTVMALQNLAELYAHQGMTDEARPLAEQSLATYRAMGDLRGVEDSLSILAMSALHTGEYERARELFDECVRSLQAAGDDNQLAIALRMRGYAMLYQQQPEAGSNFLQSLHLNERLSDRQGIAACLSACAAAAIANDQFERAARLLGAVEAVLETVHAEMWIYDNDQYIPRVTALRAQMPAAAFNAAWAQGRALTMEQTLAEAEAVVADAARAAQPSITPAPTAAFPAGLTAREVEVLHLLAQGVTDAQIAETLVISVRTVNSHLRSIYSKLDVTTRTAAARYAVEFKL